MSIFFTRCKRKRAGVRRFKGFEFKVDGKLHNRFHPEPMNDNQSFYSFGGLNFINAPYFLNMTSPLG